MFFFQRPNAVRWTAFRLRHLRFVMSSLHSLFSFFVTLNDILVNVSLKLVPFEFELIQHYDGSVSVILIALRSGLLENFAVLSQPTTWLRSFSRSLSKLYMTSLLRILIGRLCFCVARSLSTMHRVTFQAKLSMSLFFPREAGLL